MSFHYINFSVLCAITSWTFKTIIWIHRQPWDTKETWSCLFLVTRHILFLSSHAQLLKPKLDEECVCQTLFMGIIFFKIVTSLKRPSIRTDSAEIWRATEISLGTAPLHPVYLRCHLHCRFTWCRSSLLCRRQPTLPPLPSRRPTVCRSQIGWVHRKSRGLDEVESAEAELRQDSIHVAWIQTAVGEDRHKDHIDRWTLYRILDFRQESRRDIRQWTGNGPACQQHHPQLFLSVETPEIHPTITFHGCHENIGPFPHIKSCRLL